MSHPDDPIYSGPAPDDWPVSVAGPPPAEYDPDAVNRSMAAWGDPLWNPGRSEPGTWTAPEDTEQRWGYATPMCRHGQAGECVQCETECVHGNDGPSCRQCEEGYR